METAALQLFVTGATGFVGTHLLDVLAEAGHAVRALVRRPADAERLARRGIDVVPGTLSPGEHLARAVSGVDVVVHLAAATRARSEAEYHQTNADGTRALVDALLRADPPPRRLVYLSSLAAAGPADMRPVGRDDAPRPLTAYGHSKLAGEAICLEAADPLEVTVLRAPAVYGPRDRDLLTFFRLAARGLVPIPAGAERRVQLVHVQDLARAISAAAVASGASGVYHIAEPRAYGWRDIVGMIGEAVGARVRMVPVPTWSVHLAALCSEWVSGLRGQPTIFNRDKARELLAAAWLCETERARDELGFVAAIPLRDGLAATAQWYRAAGWL